MESGAEERALRWWAWLSESSNESFLPLYLDEHRYLVLKGGAGSGKSVFAGRKLLERCIREPGHRFLVCRKVARTLRESCFRQLCGQLSEHYPKEPVRINKTDMGISFPRSGSELIFSGLDDVEKLKSIYGITGIWIEEASEITEADFNQLDIRLRGTTREYQQIILSFNPVNVNHWLKKRFFDRRDERARTHESSYRNNRFLDANAIRTLEAFAETDEYYYTVYCLGQWGSSGRTVFDGRAIGQRLRELPPPLRTGLFRYDDDGRRLSGIAWEDSHSGCVRVFAPPEEGVPYVIGADTAGTGSDSFAAQVLDNRSGAQAAILRGHFDEDVFARQLFALGMYYNGALIACETNFSTYTVMELERLRYPRQYVRESIDDFTHQPRQSFGFVTNQRTRPVIISELIRALREDISLVSDETTLQELLTFVRNEETLRPEAEPGAHDDCVMSLAIAHFVRPQQSYLPRSAAPDFSVWTEDMWEDWQNADDEERRRILEARTRKE